MAVRIFTGLTLTAVFLGIVLFAPPWGIQAFLGLAACLAAWEFAGLGGDGVRKTDQAIAVAAVLVLLVVASLWPGNIVPVFMGLSLVVLLYTLFTHAPMPTAGQRATVLLAVVAYIGLFFTALVLVAALGPKGRYLVLVAAAVAFLGDTAAYFGGKAMGRHKLWPAVSPKKTWEGSFWGIFGSILGALAVKWLFFKGFGYTALITLGIVGGALGQTGDWVESAFKRSRGVKDSGNILPGHGGVYDRVDAFMFVGVVTYIWAALGWL